MLGPWGPNVGVGAVSRLAPGSEYCRSPPLPFPYLPPGSCVVKQVREPFESSRSAMKDFTYMGCWKDEPSPWALDGSTRSDMWEGGTTTNCADMCQARLYNIISYAATAVSPLLL